MAWFNFFHRSIKEPTHTDQLINSKLLKQLDINRSLAIKNSCDLELQSKLEAVYTPLPQRIFSIGQLTLTPNITIKRYYLVDDDTWLQVSYSKTSVHEIILFYWVHAKTILPAELTQSIKAPLTSLQWEHRGTLFDRCWQLPKQNKPLEIVEDIYNLEAKYNITSQQMLFSRSIGHRKEYWLYSLESNQQAHCYQQTIAQGFSLLENDILIN